MAQKIFQIYDGRRNFWQWDTKQKLIVLDDTITQVHFSNKNMKHSVSRDVYESNGIRLVNVPDTLLQVPVNLVVYAYINNGKSRSTKSSVTFSVAERPIPFNDGSDCAEVVEDMLTRIEQLEKLLKDVEAGTQQLIKFTSMTDAVKWAMESGQPGDIVVIKLNAGWVPHVVEDNKLLTPICNCDGEMVTIALDGDNADGIPDDEIEIYYDGNYMEDEKLIQYFDGGSATGI